MAELQAHGEHLIVQLPPRKEASDAGIVLPGDLDVKYSYGRVLSVGHKIDPTTVQAGDIAVFDHMGARELELDPIRDQGVLVIHESMLFGVTDDEYLRDAKVPVPVGLELKV